MPLELDNKVNILQSSAIDNLALEFIFWLEIFLQHLKIFSFRLKSICIL